MCCSSDNIYAVIYKILIGLFVFFLVGSNPLNLDALESLGDQDSSLEKNGHQNANCNAFLYI
jgi:hypothetical protein